MMRMTKATLSIIFLIVLSACVSTGVQHGSKQSFFNEILQQTIHVQHRDLAEQTRSGDGEGLAKPVPGQPLLINNQILFAMMSDPALGVAMTVGTINKTVALFAEMPNISILDWTHTALLKHADDSQWVSMLGALVMEKQHIVLEPYAYLNGYPDAVLQLRLRVSLNSEQGSLWTSELLEASDPAPLEGEKSWSAHNGKAVMYFMRERLPRLIEQLPQLLAQ